MQEKERKKKDIERDSDKDRKRGEVPIAKKCHHTLGLVDLLSFHSLGVENPCALLALCHIDVSLPDTW